MFNNYKLKNQVKWLENLHYRSFQRILKFKTLFNNYLETF